MSLVLQRFTHTDIPAVCDYIESIREFEEIVRVIPKDRPVCEEKLRSLLEGGEGIGVVVYDTEYDKVVGIGLAILVEMWWTSDKTWNNVLLFVDPRYRQSGAYSLLMDFFKKLPDATGIPLYFDVISGPETNFKVYDRVFTSKGLTRVGTSFIYEPKDRAA